MDFKMLMIDSHFNQVTNPEPLIDYLLLYPLPPLPPKKTTFKDKTNVFLALYWKELILISP